MKTDRELIDALGGASKVAQLLGFKKHSGPRRVHNWLTRGIPARIKLQYPHYFIDKHAS